MAEKALSSLDARGERREQELWEESLKLAGVKNGRPCLRIGGDI
jgi:hypothetical protein